MKILRAIPNIITSFNLLFGCVAIVFALRGLTAFSVYCIAFAAVLDFCDGFAARLLKAYSEIGKQLDSIADIVSFGVAPAALLHSKLHFILQNKITSGLDASLYWWEILTLAPFIVTVFSALRLAKFNIDPRQSSGFIGLPTPACALLICSFISLSVDGHWFAAFMEQWYAVLVFCVALSILLVCNMPMFAMKFKNMKWRDNKIRFEFIALCLIVIGYSVIFQQPASFAVSIIFIGYIAMSFLIFLFKKQKTNFKQ